MKKFIVILCCCLSIFLDIDAQPKVMKLLVKDKAKQEVEARPEVKVVLPDLSKFKKIGVANSSVSKSKSKAMSSPKIYTEKLDSIISPSEKFYFEYDSYGNVVGYEYYYQDWLDIVGSMKEAYSYDPNGNLVSYETYYWDSYNKEWRKDNLYEYDYDAQARRTMYKEYEWDGTDWEGRSYYINAYDSYGNEILEENYRWVNGQWEKSSKWEYAYDDRGNQTMYAYYNVQDGEWKGDYKREYAYDSDERKVLESDYVWNNGAWVGNYKNTYEYDALGHEINHSYFQWRNNEWMFIGVFETTYDGKKMIKQEYYEVDGEELVKLIDSDLTISGNTYTFTLNQRLWDYGIADYKMKPSAVYVTTYDNKDNIIEYKESCYDGETLVPQTRESYSYDGLNNQRTYVKYEWDSYYKKWQGVERYDSDYYLNFEMSRTNYEWTGSRWEKYSMVVYGYDRNGEQYVSADYYWNSESEIWEGNNKCIREFDDQNNEIYNEDFTWENGAWQPIGKVLREYDSLGNELLSESYYYEDGAYVGNSKTERVYNEAGKLKLYANYYWSSSDHDWTQNSKEENTYNEFGDIETEKRYYSSDQPYFSASYTYDGTVDASTIAGFGGLARKPLFAYEEISGETITFYYSEMTSNVVNATITVRNGWNWISVPTENSLTYDAKQFLDALGQNEYIASQTESLYNDETLGWFGELTRLSAKQSYKLKSVNPEPVELTLSGYVSEGAISLNEGWTWIGYNSSATKTISDALPTAVEGDVVKSKNGFATYSDGAWTGDVTMTPGQGYMYKTTEARDITYDNSNTASSAKRMQKAEQRIEGFEFDESKFSDNTAVIATLDNNMLSNRYAVVAFAGGECRGVSQEHNGMYFITVHGNVTGETIEFRLYDKITGVTTNLNETARFNGGIVGTMYQPLILSSGNATGISNVSSDNNETYYDVQGRKLVAIPTHGLYIKNGKKVIK